MAKRRQRNSAVQNSPLLNLPGELRNTIYEYAAQNTDSISIRHDRTLYCPPLSLVCRQVRKEYEFVYLQKSPRYACKVHIHITNFVYRHLRIAEVGSSIARLPPPVPGIERRYNLRIYLTNFWDQHRPELRDLVGAAGSILAGEARVPISNVHDLDVEFRWDPKSFDVEFLRENLPKLRFCVGKPSRWGDMKPSWVQLENAIRDAMERYSPKARTKAPKRKCKRQNDASNEDGGPKRRRKGV